MILFTIIGVIVVIWFIVDHTGKSKATLMQPNVTYKEKSLIMGCVIASMEGLKEGDYEKALDLIKQARELDPSNKHFTTLIETISEAIIKNKTFTDEEIGHTFSVIAMQY
jgi:hypothetical protein